MGKVARVLRLEKQAFEVAFKGIIADLQLSPEHCTSSLNNKPCLNSSSFVLSVVNFTNGEYIRDLTRQRLNQVLVGLVSDDVRARLVEQYMKQYASPDGSSVRPSSFLSCILDGSFKKLDISAVNPDFLPDVDLIPVITRYAPMLQELILDFSSCSEREAAQEVLKVMLKELKLLDNLTDLTLKKLPGKCKGILTTIGTFCPKLVSLRLGLHSSVPVKLMNPECCSSLCDTLKCIDFEIGPRDFCRSQQSQMKYEIAFLLRHLPNLEFLKSSNSVVSEAIELLSRKCDIDLRDDIPKLENCKAQNYTGKLKLKEIKKINLGSGAIVKAVAVLCPCLETVEFIECWEEWDSGMRLFKPELQFMFEKFAKVTKLSFGSVEPSAYPLAMNVWARHLSSFAVTGASEFELGLLFECLNLTELSIGKECKVAASERFDWTKPFLPNLACLEIDSCLHGVLENYMAERVLLRKSTLKQVSLLCCHAYKDSSSWENLFRLWLEVTSFHIKSARGFSAELVKRLRQLMPRLKEVTLPSHLRNTKNERHLLDDLQENWKEDGVTLDFDKTSSSNRCRDRPNTVMWEPSDGEGDTDVICDDDDDDEFKTFLCYYLSNHRNHFVFRGFHNEPSSDEYDEYDENDGFEDQHMG